MSKQTLWREKTTCCAGWKQCKYRPRPPQVSPSATSSCPPSPSHRPLPTSFLTWRVRQTLNPGLIFQNGIVAPCPGKARFRMTLGSASQCHIVPHAGNHHLGWQSTIQLLTTCLNCQRTPSTPFPIKKWSHLLFRPIHKQWLMGVRRWWPILGQWLMGVWR